MALVSKSPDAEIFWEAIGPKGRSMYIRSIDEDKKYVDQQWQDIPKQIRSELGKEMNRHYRKPKLPKGAWRGVESKKVTVYGSDQTRGIIGEEGTNRPNVKRLRPEKKKLAPLLAAAGGLAARAVVGAAVRGAGKKILGDDDDEEKAFVNKPFGEYKNWQACKDDGKTDKYCGWLKSKLEKRENKQLLIEAIQENGGAIEESVFKSNGICPCGLEGTIIENKAIVKYNNAITFIVQNRGDIVSMQTINKYNPAGGSYYEDPNIIKIGDKVIYAGGEGQVVTLTGNYVTILKDDKTKDMVHIRSVIRKTDIIYTEKSGLTCWNGISAGEKQTILQKAGIPLSFISKDWVDIPMNIKNVIQAKFGQPTNKEEHKEEDKDEDKEKKKQTLDTSDIGVDVPPKDATPKQEQAYNEARTLYFEIKDTWGGSADLGRFVRDHRESERKYNKNWLMDLERKINNAIKLGFLHHKLGVLSIVDTKKAESKKKQSISKDTYSCPSCGEKFSSRIKKKIHMMKEHKDKVSENWPNYGDAGDAGNRDNSTQQGSGQDYSSNVKRNSKKKQIRQDDKERKDRKEGDNISEHDKADANITTDTSGVSNPVYGGEKKPKKKKGVSGVLREVAVASANQATGTGLIRETKVPKPKKPKAGQTTGTKKPESTSKQPVRKWVVGVPENVPINGIRPFIVKEEIELDEIASEYYRPIEQDANFKKPKRSEKPDKIPQTDKPPKMMKPQAYSGAYAA